MPRAASGGGTEQPIWGIPKEYWPKLAVMVKELTGCEKVFVQSQAPREPNPKNIFMNPAKFAHSDATEKSPPQWRKFLVKKQGYTQEVRPTVGRRPPEDSIPTTATGSRPPGGTGSRRGSAAFFFTDCSFLTRY